MRLSQAARPLETAIRQVSRIMGIVAVILLVAMMMLTVTDVVMRYFFNNPVTASMELTEWLMLFVAFLGLAWCALRGGHIKVEIIVGRFPRRTQEIINSINALILICLCAFMAWRAFAESFVSRQMHYASDVTGIPHWPFYILTAFGFALLFLAMTIILVNSINNAVKK